MSNLNETLKSGLGGDGAYGFQFVVKFTSEKTSTAGQTKINWTISTQDIYPYDGSWHNAMAEVFLNFSGYNGGTVTNIQNNRYEWVHTNFNPGLKILEGSCIVVHNSSGKGGFTVQLDGNIGGYCDATIDRSASYSLDDYIPYSKCAAPVAIGIPAKVVPSGSFTVSWDQAKAGTSNPIVKYELYYKITKEGTVPTLSSYDKKITINSTSVKGSTTITTSNATRGYKIQYAIRTIGKIEGYHSDLKTFGPTVINSLPSAPTVSATYSNGKNVLPSTGGQVEFNITAGSDNDPLSSFSIAYSLSSTGSPQKITSPFTCNITNTSTYYFWTFDGIEYSAATTKKIIVNTKPKIDKIKIEGIDLQSKNKIEGSRYIIQPTITTTASDGQNRKEYEYKLYYGKSSSSLNSSVTLSSKASNVFRINDVRQYFSPDEDIAYYYQIGVMCNDGIENSEEAFSEVCHITKVPALKGIYNQNNFTNLDGFAEDGNATYYSKFLSFIFEKDEGYNLLSFNNINNVKQSISLTTGIEDTRGSWEDTVVSKDGKNYNLILQIGHVNAKSIKTINYKITKISYMSLSNFQFAFSQTNAFRYFTHEEGAKNPIMLATPFPKDDYKNYGMNSNEVILFNFYIKYGNKKSTIQSGGLTFSNDATVQFNLPAKTMVSLINDLLEENEKNKTRTFSLQLVLANAFEDSVSINTDFLVDFNETESIDWGEEKFSIFPRGRTESINLWKYLTQGMKALEGNFEIKSYNTNPEGHIYIKHSTNPNVWNEIASFDFSRSGNSAAPRTPAKYTISNVLVQEIGEISELEYEVSYKLKVITNSGEKEFELYNEIPVRGHRPPILSINSNTYKNNVLTINYEIKDFGVKINDKFVSLGNNNKVSLYPRKEEEIFYIVKDNELSTFFDSLNKNKTAIFDNYDFGGEESQLVQLSITTILPCYLIKKDPDDGTEKLVLIEEFQSSKSVNLEASQPSAIFNLVPTVAYRKNHLGINILNPSENSDAIIIIGESQGRDSIYFQSSDGKYCKVINFHLDGGTW